MLIFFQTLTRQVILILRVSGRKYVDHFILVQPVFFRSRKFNSTELFNFSTFTDFQNRNKPKEEYSWWLMDGEFDYVSYYLVQLQLDSRMLRKEIHQI